MSVHNFSNCFNGFVRSYRHTHYDITSQNGYIRNAKIIINSMIESLKYMKTDKAFLEL